ncbi:hypothetical protein [Salinicola sp. CR57]|uniref:hypothetical protein n=1 Tax=Salinicola sp. CR57 TaxID=1949086 RepID=UPI001E5F2149|nr:hypothetical protein [Salinicola sp. CR57]
MGALTRSFGGLLVFGITLSMPAWGLEQPSGSILLTVSGNIGTTNVGDTAQFDRAMLESLTGGRTQTHTPWHDGLMTFEGPLGRAVLQAVDARGDALRVVALNDYAATIPVGDWQRFDVLLALTANGEPLRVRDYGPIFVIYPFDDHPELKNEDIVTRSVWQVTRIEVQ